MVGFAPGGPAKFDKKSCNWRGPGLSWRDRTVTLCTTNGILWLTHSTLRHEGHFHQQARDMLCHHWLDKVTRYHQQSLVARAHLPAPNSSYLHTRLLRWEGPVFPQKGAKTHPFTSVPCCALLCSHGSAAWGSAPSVAGHHWEGALMLPQNQCCGHSEVCVLLRARGAADSMRLTKGLWMPLVPLESTGG